MHSIKLAVLILIAAGLTARAQTPAALPTGYVGSEICKICHEDIYNAFGKSPHNAVETSAKRGFEGRACESCHGPAQMHTESPSAATIRNPAKLAAAAADKICLTCHLNQPTHVGRLESSHAKNQVSCTSCHKVHANGPNGLVNRKPAAINEQCASCHTNVWAQFQRPNHHKLPDGAIS
jgi:DmsE family decaheme c-type cytochrome